MVTSVTTRRNTLAAAFGLVQRGLKIPGREAAPLSGRGVCPKRLVRVLSAHSVLNLVSEGQTELAQLDPVNGTFKLTHLSADRHFESDPPCLAVCCPHA